MFNLEAMLCARSSKIDTEIGKIMKVLDNMDLVSDERVYLYDFNGSPCLRIINIIPEFEEYNRGVLMKALTEELSRRGFDIIKINLSDGANELIVGKGKGDEDGYLIEYAKKGLL